MVLIYLHKKNLKF